ncbi:MAG: hypothetical protein AB8G95_01890 [Anaerolineae bacterium]
MMRIQDDEPEYRRERSWFGLFLLRAIWMVFLAVISWYVAQWLLFESELLTIETLYRGGFPRTLPEEVIAYIVTATVFLLINIFIMIGYFLAQPSGRRRADRPTTYSRKPDYYR